MISSSGFQQGVGGPGAVCPSLHVITIDAGRSVLFFFIFFFITLFFMDALHKLFQQGMLDCKVDTMIFSHLLY